MTEGATQPAELVDSIRQQARGQFLDHLNDVSGKKVLLLDSSISGPLDLIASTSDLKEHGVEQWFKLGNDPVVSDFVQMLFLVRSSRVELLDCVASQIHADEAAGKDRMYVVIFVPGKTEQCEKRLEERKVRANVRITEFPLHFLPYDKDILSLELPSLFRDFHVHGEPSSIFYCAKALMSLEPFGAQTMNSIGQAAKCVVDTMIRLRKEMPKVADVSRELQQKGVPPVAPHSEKKESQAAATSPISSLIIIDRRVDIFSLLCSQFTYQALIDAFFGIQNNTVDVSKTDWAGDATRVALSPEEPLFQGVRDLHIESLGPLLQQMAVEIQETYNERETVTQGQDQKGMVQYVAKFMSARQTHQLLQTHINLAYDLKTSTGADAFQSQLRLEDEITGRSSQASLDQIEELIDQQRPIHEVLRLLCLYSLVNSGIKPKQLDVLKRNMLQAYGYEHLLTFCHLEKVGLLRYASGRSVWPGIKKNFNLFVEDSEVMKDISYAYSGYAPLSVRLVEMKSNPSGWRASQDALSLLYGPAQELQLQERPPSASELVVVCFLGGVTYGEIAALRRLSELEDGRRKFLIITTEFINVKKLFDSMKDEELSRPVAPKGRDQRAARRR